MLEVGTIIASKDPTATEYFVVTGITARRPVLEPLDSFIMRNYVVQTGDIYCTIKELVEDERHKMLQKGVIDV